MPLIGLESPSTSHWAPSCSSESRINVSDNSANTTSSTRRSVGGTDAGFVGSLLHHFDRSADKEGTVHREGVLLSFNVLELNIGKSKKTLKNGTIEGCRL